MEIPNQKILWDLERQLKEAIKELDEASPADRDKVQAKVDGLRSEMKAEWYRVEDKLQAYAETV
jgi:glucan phosphorylase